MNTRTVYELTIADKLQHLPLPGMEDAIWARIKTGLDLDLPTDDDGGGPPDAPAGSGWMWGAGTFVFIAAFVTIFSLTKNNTNSKQPLPVKTIEKTTLLPAATGGNVSNTQQQPEGRRVTAAPRFTPGTSPSLPLTIVADSLLYQPSAALPLFDSLRSTTFAPPPTPVVQDSVLLKKKPRGVSGLTDNDYRIVPAKKDSL